MKLEKMILMKLKKLCWAPAALGLSVVLAAGVFAVGCAGDAPVSRDGGNHTKYDTGNTRKDSNPWQYDLPPKKDVPTTKADQYIWPDTGGGKVDTWSWPTDTYSGVPFGCHVDSDCFGKLCCPTPWGVKVCADVCSP